MMCCRFSDVDCLVRRPAHGGEGNPLVGVRARRGRLRGVAADVATATPPVSSARQQRRPEAVRWGMPDRHPALRRRQPARTIVSPSPQPGTVADGADAADESSGGVARLGPDIDQVAGQPWSLGLPDAGRSGACSLALGDILVERFHRSRDAVFAADPFPKRHRSRPDPRVTRRAPNRCD